MANDPLPLPDISAEPPPDNTHGADDVHGAHGSDDAQEAEYEAIHAEIAATARGRWFLSEHAKRNRAADTDRLVSSLVRAEAAMRGDGAVEAGRPDESLAVEPAPSESVIGEAAVAEPVEPPVTEAAPAASPDSVTPSMWETAAALQAEPMATSLGPPQASDLGDAETPAQPANELRASTENVCANLSDQEAVVDDALPPALGEAAVVNEPLPEAGLAREEAQVRAVITEQSSEESTIASSLPLLVTAQEVKPEFEFHTGAVHFAAEVPVNDENAGIIAPAEEGIGPSATDGSEPTWSADDDIESLLDAEPAAPLPTTTRPAAVQEDLDDLFELLPLEPDVKRAAVAAVQREPPQQMFSPELRAPAFPGSAAQIGVSPAEPPAFLVASAPAARTIPRPAPNDPLAAVRALSEEELIALFS